MAGTVHVVGAGLAGLSTALRLANRGVDVRLWEGAGQAGGRCRSFEDARLGRRIDNGNHLVLTGNGAVKRFLATTGGRMDSAPEAAFPFVDLATDERWTVRLNAGPVPWWVMAPSRRIPGTGPMDYLGGIGLAISGEGRTVSEAVRGRGPIWHRFWEPLSLAVLNMPPEEGAAHLLWAVMRETFLLGAGRSKPLFAPDGLGEALIAPAMRWLEACGVRPALNRPLKGLEIAGGRAAALRFGEGEGVPLGSEDRVVLALPPGRLGPILPDLRLPRDDRAILNAHFVVPDAGILAGKPPFLGVISARTHWIFVRGDVISLTISAADALGFNEAPAEDLLPHLWTETCAALGLQRGTGYQAARMIRERRATFDQSPEGARLRPTARTPLANVYLAGDATATGLPATIEGALRSGETAAGLAVRGNG